MILRWCFTHLVFPSCLLLFLFRNYNASKYSSSCGNTLGDFLKNATNGVNTSSGGFSSTEPNMNRQEQHHRPGDLNNGAGYQQIPSNVSRSDCEETAERSDYRQHRRRGSDSVTKDSGLDFSHIQETGMHEKHSSAEQAKRNRSKSDSSRSKSLGDIVEPLNSERLRPIRQKTRNAVVSILDDGEVALEFFHRKSGEDKVFEVLRISQNGMKITVYQPNGKAGVPLSSQPPPPSGCDSTCSYLFSNLPSKYWKKYQYATRFVHLVRKKTPKVNTIISPFFRRRKIQHARQFFSVHWMLDFYLAGHNVFQACKMHAYGKFSKCWFWSVLL